MIRTLLVILFLFSSYHITFAQTIDSVEVEYHKKFPLKSFILPVTLISTGILANNKHFKNEFRSEIIKPVFGDDFQWKGDDYFQYAPIVILYGAGTLTKQHKNNLWVETKYLIISNLMNGLVTWGIKSTIPSTRPNGANHAFPSGHTSLAFTNAALLYEEYKDDNLWIAYSGYAFAIATGVLRMGNDKHWISDVLVGAGIGIGVVKLVYWLEPLKNWVPFKKNNLVIFPSFQDKSFQIGLHYNL